MSMKTKFIDRIWWWLRADTRLATDQEISRCMSFFSLIVFLWQYSSIRDNDTLWLVLVRLTGWAVRGPKHRTSAGDTHTHLASSPSVENQRSPGFYDITVEDYSRLSQITTKTNSHQLHRFVLLSSRERLTYNKPAISITKTTPHCWQRYENVLQYFRVRAWLSVFCVQHCQGNTSCYFVVTRLGRLVLPCTPRKPD